VDVYGGDENIIILKCRFKASESNTYGLIILSISESQQSIENLTAIASHYSSIYEIDPSIPWYTFEENVTDLKWKGDIAVNVTIDLQNFLQSSLQRDRGSELYMLIKNNDAPKIEALLQSLLMKPLSDRNITIDTASDTVSAESMREVRAERNRPRGRPSSPPSGSVRKEAGAYIDLDLLLAPVSGIPIFDLKVGDKIMVKISGTTSKGRHYIDLLGARVDGSVIPVPGEVTKIDKQENEYAIICKLEGGIFGRAVEAEKVKLKKYDELFTQKEPQEIPLAEVQPGESKGRFPLFVLVVGGLMFTVFLIFILMWIYNVL